MPAPTELPDWAHDRRQRIGRHIQRQREHANLTQDTLVTRTGLSRSTIQRVEAGGEARLSWLILIADALGVDLADLVRLPDAR